MTATEPNYYWVNKLLPFKQGCRQFARGTPLAHPGPRSLAPLPEGIPADRLLPALALVWARHAAADEVLVASEHAAGPMFQRLAVRPEMTVREFLHACGAECREGHENAGFDFQTVVTLLGMESAAVALFEVSLLATSSPFHSRAAVAVAPDGSAVSVSAALGDRFAARLANHLSRAVAFLADSTATLGSFDLLTDDERRQILAFQGETRPRPQGLLLHQLVQRQAASRPDAMAVVHASGTLTYGALDEASNRLAAHLIGTLGVRPGDLVGLVLTRSHWMIAALLGVLKAGAGYVPINPRQPGENVSYMLRNAGVRALLVDSPSAAGAAGFRGELCFVDLELPTLPPAARPLPLPASSDLAYVIYTSGSTGKPKGVAIEHRAIVNTVLWRNDFYRMDEDDATLQMPSYAFDSAVLDIFCTLASGGKLVIPDEDLRLDAEYLKRMVREHGITRCIVTPSYYAILHRELSGPNRLRSITVAGENTTLDLVASHHRHQPGVRLINEYGPTENAVCSTASELREGATGVDIGGPIANTQVFVLDDAGRLAPIGVPGEIYLAGVGLARGYVGQPELTAERFVPSAVAEYPGRMYKTGDWAMWREDGTLEFLGRVDNQVKLRGFRIELNEIEHVLSARPEVDMAAVLCKDDGRGGKYLAAYVATSRPLPAPELTAWVRGRLPYYMVPDVVRVLTRLPLTLNGKVDQKALRELPDFEAASGDGAAPATAIQETLSSLCVEVLRHGRIGIDDNLFSLGANSLHVMEMVSRIRADLNADIELVDVYACPTIRELSRSIEHRLLPKASAAARP